jgi:hypothetical protein
MSGICMAVAAATSGGAAAPLACSVIFTGGAGPINVSGASGSLSPSGGVNLISVDASGGTPPYSGAGVTLQGDPSGKLSISLSGDGIHNTISWSGFAVNETQGCYLQNDVTDNVGATATSRYPSSGSIIIKRTS